MENKFYMQNGNVVFGATGEIIPENPADPMWQQYLAWTVSYTPQDFTGEQAPAPTDLGEIVGSIDSTSEVLTEAQANNDTPLLPGV